MFPGFVSLYKKDGKSHLFFFPGIDDQGKQVYMSLDMSNIDSDYTFVKNSDKSIDYTFATEVKKVTADLVYRKDGLSNRMTVTIEYKEE